MWRLLMPAAGVMAVAPLPTAVFPTAVVATEDAPLLPLRRGAWPKEAAEGLRCGLGATDEALRFGPPPGVWAERSLRPRKRGLSSLSSLPFRRPPLLSSSSLLLLLLPPRRRLSFFLSLSFLDFFSFSFFLSRFAFLAGPSSLSPSSLLLACVFRRGVTAFSSSSEDGTSESSSSSDEEEDEEEEEDSLLSSLLLSSDSVTLSVSESAAEATSGDASPRSASKIAANSASIASNAAASAAPSLPPLPPPPLSIAARAPMARLALGRRMR